MRLNKFKNELKKEFNESYKEKYDYELVKPVKRVNLKLVFTSSFIIFFVAFFSFFAIYNTRVNIHNSNVELNKANLVNNIETKDIFNLDKANVKELKNRKWDYLYEKNLNIIPEYGMNVSKDTSYTQAPVEPANSGSENNNYDNNNYETNNQIEGINEADIAKFDTKYVYLIITKNNLPTLLIYNLEGNKLIEKEIIPKINVNQQQYNREYNIYEVSLGYFKNSCNMQIHDDKIIIFDSTYLIIFKFDGTKLEAVYETNYDKLLTTRLVDNYLYVVTNVYLKNEEIQGESYTNNCLMNYSCITKMYKINLETLAIKEVNDIANNTNFIYMDKNYIVIPIMLYLNNTPYTFLDTFDHDLNPIVSFKIKGTIKDQYSISIKDNYLRVVSTNASREQNKVNQLKIFDISKKEKTSSIEENLGVGLEIVKSVTFEDDLCYVVTYKNTDPLYEIDLSDPKNPKIISQLKVPGYSEYLHKFEANGKNYVLGLGVTDDGFKKISLYEVENGENIQIGNDFVIVGSYYKNHPFNDFDLILEKTMIQDLFKHGYEMFFYEYDNKLYFGASFSQNEYYLFEINPVNENPIVIYKSFKTSNETRLFLYQNKLYLPTSEKLIIENF